MPNTPSTETSSRLNGMSNVSHNLPHLSRRLAFMVADFGSAFKYSACPTVPQSDDYVVTAPEVSLQPVTQGMPPMLSPRERAYPTVPQSASLTAPLTQGSLGDGVASMQHPRECAIIKSRIFPITSDKICYSVIAQPQTPHHKNY